MKLRMALGAVAVVALAVASWGYQENMDFHPSVRYAVPEGYSLSMIQAPVKTHELCQAANERVLAPVRRDCPTCRIESATCDWRMSERERSIRDGTIRDAYLIATPGMTMVLEGADGPARTACTQIATLLAGKMANSVACRFPASSPGAKP